MDFGKNLLQKYGWKEGQGIGKNSDGIVNPIKPNLKFDTAGLGHDRAKEFTDHWWERAFNNAANNVNVSQASNNVAISTINSDAVEITTNGFSTKQIKISSESGHGYRDSFLKSRSTARTLISSDDDEDMLPEKRPNRVLTDEELLKACGGRTAHKGARHGLTQRGKLSRIEAQEQDILAKTINTAIASTSFANWSTVKRKKKKCRPEPLANVEPDPIKHLLHKEKKHCDLTTRPTRNEQETTEKGFDMDDMLDGVLQCSKAIQKELSKKKKKEKRKQKKLKQLNQHKDNSDGDEEMVQKKQKHKHNMLHGVSESSTSIQKVKNKKYKKHKYYKKSKTQPESYERVENL